MKRHFDVAVVGSGFSGSLIAMIARRVGLSVVLIEKSKHPRMTIGESSTPLSNVLLEQIADRYDLPRLKPLSKWGTWQREYPAIACGLKRGFSFFHHAQDKSSSQLLVGASPCDEVADTHWYRSDFDALLIEQARETGVEYYDETAISECLNVAGDWHLIALRRGQKLQLRAKFLLDASGPRGFLHNALELDELDFPGYPMTSSLYSHFSAVQRFQDVHPERIMNPSFSVDEAALHHVFSHQYEGGWIWILRFNNGLTSAGAAGTQKVAEHFGFQDGEAAWGRLLNYLPDVKDQFAKAKHETAFRYIPKVSFLSSAIVGQGWAQLPSAAGFIDPMLSTGFPLALLGVLRIGLILEKYWNTPGFTESLNDYARRTYDELMAAARLLQALYRNMGDFATFRTVSMLYFAAASYAETARRLDKPELASSYLLESHPLFGPESARLLLQARNGISLENQPKFEADVYKLVDPFDVAGLGRRPKDHSYSVDAKDLLSAASKFGATEWEMENLLERSGFSRVTGAQPS